MLKLEAESEQRQVELGGELAAVTPAQCIIYLEGDLGAGKTTLVRGFMRGLGYSGPVKSPTYTLMEPYEVAGRTCYHFDLYRLADPGELEYLGLRDMLDHEAVLIFEWPEKGAGELPQADLVLKIAHLAQGRGIEMIPESERGEGVLTNLSDRLR